MPAPQFFPSPQLSTEAPWHQRKGKHHHKGTAFIGHFGSEKCIFSHCGYKSIGNLLFTTTRKLLLYEKWEVKSKQADEGFYPLKEAGRHWHRQETFGQVSELILPFSDTEML